MVILDDALSINGTAVTASAAELNILDGVTSTATELNLLDGVTTLYGSGALGIDSESNIGIGSTTLAILHLASATMPMAAAR